MTNLNYFWSGIRESNPPPRLGKPVHYRCANSANPDSNAFSLGADTRTRTGDLRITNALLYQLSHIGNPSVVHPQGLEPWTP